MKRFYENPNIAFYRGKNELFGEDNEIASRKVFHCYRSFLPYIRGRVLDVGAGNGIVTNALANESTWKELTCIDASPRNTAVLKRYGYKVCRHDIDQFPYPLRGRYDTIIMTDVIEHVLSPYLVLREVHRLLAPDGWLILTTPDAKRTNVTIPHIGYFTSESMELLLRRAGFANIRRHYNGIISPELTMLTSKVPVVRSLLSDGLYYVAQRGILPEEREVMQHDDRQ